MPVRAEGSRTSEPTLSGLGSVRHGLSCWEGEFAEETGKCPDLGVGRTDTSGPGSPARLRPLVCTPLCPLLRPSLSVNGLSLPSPRKSAARGSSQAGLCPGSGAAPHGAQQPRGLGRQRGPRPETTLAVDRRMGGLWQRWGGSLDSVKSLNKFVEVTGHLQMNNVTLRKKFAQTPCFAAHVKPAARPHLTLTELKGKMFSQLPSRRIQLHEVRICQEAGKFWPQNI